MWRWKVLFLPAAAVLQRATASPVPPARAWPDLPGGSSHARRGLRPRANAGRLAAPPERRRLPRGRSRAVVPVLLPSLLGACAGTFNLHDRPPDAVLETRGSAQRLASCLSLAYAADPFRLEVDTGASGARITPLGAPGRVGPVSRRPRFEIEVSQAGSGGVRIALRAVPTLLGPGAEVTRLQRRVAACTAEPASGGTFRSIASTIRDEPCVLRRGPDEAHSVA